MKRVLIFLSAFLFFAPMAAAQVPAPTELQLNQPFSSQKLGELTFPFMWNVEQISADRIVATEHDSKSPAVITVDYIQYPADLKAPSIAQNTMSSLADALSASKPVVSENTICLDPKASKKCKKSVTEYSAKLTGKENDVERACSVALYFSQNDHFFLAFTLCAPEAKQFDADPLDTLKTMFKLMMGL